MFLLKLAVRPWKKAGTSQFVAALALGLLASLAAAMLWLDRALLPVISRLDGEQVITAFFEPSTNETDEKRISDEIVTSLGAASVRVVKLQDFIEDAKKEFPELGRDLEELGPSESAAIVPRHVVVSGVFPSDAVKSVRSISGVESADSSRERYAPMVQAFRAIRSISQLLSVALVIALFIGLVHISRMNTLFHADAIHLLRLWGAGPLGIRVPAALSGLSLGLLGGVFSGLTWSLVVPDLVLHLRSLSPVLSELTIPARAWGVGISLLCGLLGLGAGMVGGGGVAGESVRGED